MEPAIVVAVISAVVGIPGGIMGGIAALKQRSNENLQLTMAAMHEHMKTLSSDNIGLRKRIEECERDRAKLWDTIRSLRNGIQ